jgi:hypothetical protein
MPGTLLAIACWNSVSDGTGVPNWAPATHVLVQASSAA